MGLLHENIRWECGLWLVHRGFEIYSAEMGKRVCVMLFIFLLLFGGFSSASATTSPASEYERKKKRSPISFFIFYGFFSSLHFKLKPLIFLQKILIFSGFFSPPLHFQLKPLIFLQNLLLGFSPMHCLLSWNGCGHSPLLQKQVEISKFSVELLSFLLETVLLADNGVFLFTGLICGGILQWFLDAQCWSLRADTLWRQCLMEASLVSSHLQFRSCLMESFLYWTLITATSTRCPFHCLAVSGFFTLFICLILHNQDLFCLSLWCGSGFFFFKFLQSTSFCCFFPFVVLLVDSAVSVWFFMFNWNCIVGLVLLGFFQTQLCFLKCDVLCLLVIVVTF